jgi:hypothetical protein
MNWIRNHKRLSAGLAGLFVVAGIAAAAWMIQSSGQSGGKIGSLQAPTVSAATASTACLPGGTCDAAITVSNPNDNPLKIVGGNDNSPGNGTGFSSSCPESVIDVPVTSGFNVSVPPGTSVVHVADFWHLAADAPQGCQGIAFSKFITWLYSS